VAYGTGSNAPKIENVAIGDNTFARTGSTMIGSHNYKGDLGDTTVDTATTRTDALNAYATTVGANSFTNGAFATNTGTYNIISSGYTGGCSSNPSKNLGATINGSLNSIESKTANSYYSGVANSIVGTANRTFNSNGSIIMGAGNKITNSVKSIDGVRDDGGNSAKELAGKFREAVKESNGGGATMAFGGGNKADYTLRTSMIGINNTVTGANRAESADNLVMGVGNTGTNVQHLTAIGSNSKATVAAGAVGYDILTNAPSIDTSATWKSTAAAVSVGDAGNNVTRQITSVAAGTNDTDAVNVAQLKQLRNNIGGDITNINGNISRLDKRVNKAVAGSAALAALHPLDFDPDAKWDFAAGYGHYHNGNAAALGAFYRPNEVV